MAIDAPRTTSNFVPVNLHRINKVELLCAPADPGQPEDEPRIHIVMASYVSDEARRLNPRNPVGNESIFLTLSQLKAMGEPDPRDYFYDLAMRSKTFLGTNATPDGAAAQQYVPKVVTRRQARRALLGAGLLDTVPAAIAALDDGTPEGHKVMREVEIDWEDSSEFHRTMPTLLHLARALNLDDAALDQLFVAAGAM